MHLSRLPRVPACRSSTKQGPYLGTHSGGSCASLLPARRTPSGSREPTQGSHVAWRSQISMAGRKWQGGSSEDDGGSEPGKGRKQQRGSSRRQIEEEEEFTEDIGGVASPVLTPVVQQQEQQEQQAEEEEAWHVRRGPGRQQARAESLEGEKWQQPASEEGGAETGRGKRRWPKATWRGPREGLSANEVEQRLAVGADIKDATDWRALASFVHRQGELMDAEQAVMVLTKLSCCPPKAGGRTFRLPPSSVEAMQAAFGRPTDEEAAQQYDQLLSLLLGWILVLIPSFRPKHVSRCLAALDHMQLFNLEVTTALKDAVAKHLINFDLADYGTITATFAKFGYNPGPEFLELFTRKTARKLQLMNADELGKAASGLSALGCLPCPEWSEAFWKASYQKAPEFAGRFTATKDLLTAVAQFAQAGQQPSQEWVDAVFGVLPMAGRPNQPPRINLISMLLYTLSNISCRPSVAWCNVILEAWRRQLKYCTPSDLGTISLYVGRYLGVPVSQQLGSQLLVATLGAADRMGADEIAAVAYLLGVSQLQGSERDVDDLVHVLKQRLHECSSASREMLCVALPSLETGSELRDQELRELLEAAAKWDSKEVEQVQEPIAETVPA